MMNKEQNYTKDCHNCDRLTTDNVCPLSNRDIDTCLQNPSRPFWKPKEPTTQSKNGLICDFCSHDNAAQLGPCLNCDETYSKFVPRTGKQKKNSFSFQNVNSADPYFELNLVLQNAMKQASQGKGKERHANDNNYEDQVICIVGRLLKDHPFGAHAYQVIKKTIEAGRLYKISGPEAAYNEMLGAINYAAAMNILIKEKD
jgi:hypothetical protein